jgi:hypothetical protein
MFEIPRCARNDSTILLYGGGGKCGGGISTGSTPSRRVVIPSVARNPIPIGGVVVIPSAARNLEQIQTH